MTQEEYQTLLNIWRQAMYKCDTTKMNDIYMSLLNTFGSMR